MFSAITSFIKEMTKSTEALKKIDHGDITILLEYGEHIFGALFIKGAQTTEVKEPTFHFDLVPRDDQAKQTFCF